MKKVTISTFVFLVSVLQLSAQSTDSSLPKEVVAEHELQKNKDDKTIYTVVEQMPEFPGGLNALVEYLGKNMIYPSEAQKMGIEGTVYLNFVVTEKGEIEDIKIIKGLSKECDELALKVVKNMPKWKPGKQDGRDVAVRFVLPIRFNLTDNTSVNQLTPKEKKPADSSTVTPKEQFPEFPGGQEELLKYLDKKLKYPQEAYRRGIQGIVYLSFIIEEDGSLSNIVVQKGILKECDEEAIRVVKNMPNWIPGKQMGKAVRVKFSLPIRFKAR